ncbi:retrotransposon ORF1 [Tanacetum coccineum]
MEGCSSNLKIPCNIRHMHVEKAYIDLNSPLNIITRMMYNWIMRRKLNPRENANGGISNFTGRIKGMHVFVGNFTYVVDFMIVADISLIIDPRLSQVVLGRPFIEISNMTHDLPKGVVRFTNKNDEVAYKMPHKIEKYNSLSNLEKEHTKSVYLRNEKDKRRGVNYVMSKILGFYKECLELGPEYVTGFDDEGEVTAARPQTPQSAHPSEATIEPQSDPSPRPSPTTHILDSIPEVSGGNQGGQSSSDKSLSGNEGDMTLQSVYDLCISLCTQVTDQAKEIKHLKAQIKKLKKKAKPIITHHRAWMKSVSLKKRLAGKKSLKSIWMQKESVSKQGRKSAKAEPSVHKDPLFDELPEDTLDYMETEDAQDVGRTREVVNEEKETVNDEVSTEDVLSTAQQKVIIQKKVSTDRPEYEYDFIQARIEADRLLALRLQDEEREQFTVEERAKFLHDTIAAQRRFLAEQRAMAIRNKPPTITQLRNQMMTYLKYVGNKKHSDLKSKTFEEIQALYEKVKRFDESFTTVGSTEDERRIKEMNEGVKDTDHKRLKEENTAKVPAKVEVTEQGTKKRHLCHFGYN